MAVITTPANLAKPQAHTESGQLPTNEATQSTTPEATAPKEEVLSPKFAALARKEKALRAQAEAIKAREKALKDSEATYSQKYVDRDKLKGDPLGVLTELGLSYDDLTQLVLNGPNNQSPELYKLQQEIKALKDEQTNTKTSIQKAQEAQYEQAVNQIRADAKLLIDGNADFETIKETDNYEAVVELIKETFNTDGTLLSVEDAATQVEAYLMENALKMAQLRKIKEKLNPPAPAAEEAKQQTTQKQQPNHTKTLTSAVTAQTSRGLSERERRERAMLAFQGKLNQG